MNKLIRVLPGGLVILAFTGITLVLALPILGDQNFYSDDLAGHIALALRMAAAGGDPWFYDRAWFSGYPAFEFYGFLGHWLAAQSIAWLGGGWAGATRAVHGVIALCIISLPFSAWWFLTGWQAQRGTTSIVTAGAVAAFLATFLTMFEPETMAGLRYLITAGVFGQFPGWVLLLLYLGCLGRAVVGSRAMNWIAILMFNLAMAAHPLTSVAALIVGAVLLESHVGWRRTVVHVIALILTSAWFWFPFVTWSSGYGVGPPDSTGTTVLSVLLDGWLDFLNGISVSWWVLVAELLVAACLVKAVYSGVSGGVSLQRATIILLVVTFAINGGEFSEAFSLGVHYQRLVVTLGFVLGFMAIAAATEDLQYLPRLAALPLSGLLLLLSAQIALQPLESQPWPNTKGPGGYADEIALLERLGLLPSDSRIYFEYARKLPGAAMSPGKFVESRLWSAAKLETVNGLLVQSSRPYNLYTTVTQKLGGEAFSMPPLGWRFIQMNKLGLMELMRRNAVTHVVSAHPQFDKALRGIEGIRPVESVGRYSIYALIDPLPRLKPVSVPIVGYADLNDSLPFRYMDTFVELRGTVAGRIRLVSLEPEEVGAVPVDGLVINLETAPNDLEWRRVELTKDRTTPVLRIHFEPSRRPRIAGRTNLHDREQYEQAARYLSGSRFERLLYGFAVREEATQEAPAGNASFDWSRGGQKVGFENLSVGTWYEFAYSAFPAWQIGGGRLRQGSAGHWMFYADEQRKEATYSRLSTRPVVNGWLIAVFGLILLGGVQYRRPRLLP